MSNENPWSRIKLLLGDITGLTVDAIVNAANCRLAGGGGVDGAIHRAACSAKLQAACRELGGCDTGDAKITPGLDLPARYIIHTVGPVYGGGGSDKAALLASCYRRSLEIAVENGCKTVAFPAISTGVYGYPLDEATNIAIRTVAEFVRESDQIDRVMLIFFDDDDLYRAQRIFARLAN